MPLVVVKKFTRDITAWVANDIKFKVSRCKRLIVDGQFILAAGEIVVMVKDLDGNLIWCTREMLRNLLTYDIGADFPVEVHLRIKPVYNHNVTVIVYG